MSEADPNFAAPAKVFCASMIVGNIDQAVFDTVKQFLIERSQVDPLLTASVMDLSKLIQVDSSGAYDPALVKAAAVAMMEGIAMYETAVNKKILH